MAELEKKRYVYSFEGGGWNTVWAKTKKRAIINAKNKWKESDILNPIEDSFRADPEERIIKANYSSY